MRAYKHLFKYNGHAGGLNTSLCVCAVGYDERLCTRWFVCLALTLKIMLNSILIPFLKDRSEQLGFAHQKSSRMGLYKKEFVVRD